MAVRFSTPHCIKYREILNESSIAAQLIEIYYDSLSTLFRLMPPKEVARGLGGRPKWTYTEDVILIGLLFDHGYLTNQQFASGIAEIQRLLHAAGVPKLISKEIINNRFIRIRGRVAACKALFNNTTGISQANTVTKNAFDALSDDHRRHMQDFNPRFDDDNELVTLEESNTLIGLWANYTTMRNGGRAAEPRAPPAPIINLGRLDARDNGEDAAAAADDEEEEEENNEPQQDDDAQLHNRVAPRNRGARQPTGKDRFLDSIVQLTDMLNSPAFLGVAPAPQPEMIPFNDFIAWLQSIIPLSRTVVANLFVDRHKFNTEFKTSFMSLIGMFPDEKAFICECLCSAIGRPDAFTYDSEANLIVLRRD